eukprot:gene1192-15556_t
MQEGHRKGRRVRKGKERQEMQEGQDRQETLVGQPRQEQKEWQGVGRPMTFRTVPVQRFWKRAAPISHSLTHKLIRKNGLGRFLRVDRNDASGFFYHPFYFFCYNQRVITCKYLRIQQMRNACFGSRQRNQTIV